MRWLALLGIVAVLGPDCSPSQDRPPGTNRLIHESSPYLLLHARNPVDWFPWGEEAIELARALDRPIFLSIGYSTCYWCHRMEEDVFEVPEIAAILNEGFVSIKVDREERPDLDEIYMTATQLITQSGGWPNSVFLTTDLKPFFAGTYFPPEDLENRVGFPTVLRRILEMWKSDRAKILESADRIAEGLEEVVSGRGEPAQQLRPTDAVGRSFQALAESFDEEWGGFGDAPKFPSPADLFLLQAEASRGNGGALRMLVTTLHRMGEGALYDHLGGGFHRYATDRQWRIPHFEKMLYDNAALSEILVLTARLTRDPELERLARGTLDFVLEELTHEEGGFLSAIDAQTEGREGAYYLWTAEELEELLAPEELQLLRTVSGFGGEPNFEGKEYTVFLSAPLSEQAERLGETRAALLAKLEPVLGKLRRARERREFPLVDDKVLADWNGMMIAAMARAGAAFEEPRYRSAAERAADFILRRLRSEDGKLLHVFREGRSRIEAFLDDYAFLMRALLVLHRETGEEKWLREAESLAGELESRLRDPRGGYFQTSPKPDLLFQTKSAFDGAILSANGVVTEALLELAELTGREVYRERARAALRAFAPELERYPAGAKTLALASQRYHRERPLDPVPETSLEALADSAVEAAVAVAGETDPGWRSFVVTMSIREGWHVNANPASSPYLIPTEVRGPVRKVIYPPGGAERFAFSDDPLSVYQGEVELEGEVERGATSVLLFYQACDETRCLSPVEKVLPMEQP